MQSAADQISEPKTWSVVIMTADHIKFASETKIAAWAAATVPNNFGQYPPIGAQSDTQIMTTE